jgi:hypothetical protein
MRCKMFRLRGSGAVLFCILIVAVLFLGSAFCLYAGQTSSTISGRLAATYDSNSGTVTAMVAGYCEGNPVTIGPLTWAASEKEFSDLKAEDVGKTLCRDGLSLKRVTKSEHNGKDIVADVIIVRYE